MSIREYIQETREARKLFRATRVYNGFSNHAIAPKGLKKACYYYGEIAGSSDDAMHALTDLHQRRADYIHNANIILGVMRNAFVYGGHFSSLEDYKCVIAYLSQLCEFSSRHPLLWWWTMVANL